MSIAIFEIYRSLVYTNFHIDIFSVSHVLGRAARHTKFIVYILRPYIYETRGIWRKFDFINFT